MGAFSLFEVNFLELCLISRHMMICLQIPITQNLKDKWADMQTLTTLQPSEEAFPCLPPPQSKPPFI